MPIFQTRKLRAKKVSELPRDHAANGQKIIPSFVYSGPATCWALGQGQGYKDGDDGPFSVKGSKSFEPFGVFQDMFISATKVFLLSHARAKGQKMIWRPDIMVVGRTGMVAEGALGDDTSGDGASWFSPLLPGSPV